MRRLVVAVLVLAASLAAHGADARRYAVLSLVGDQLLVVQRELSTGSALDRNTRHVVDVPDGSVDRAVALAVDDAVRAAEPGAAPLLLAARDPRLYEAASAATASREGARRIVEAVRPQLAGSRATHLLLVARHRHRAMLRLRDGHVGSGFLEGLGFYVDHGSLARSVDTSEAERGFIAPFGYLRFMLVDLATGEVVAEERAIGSQAVGPANNAQIGNAWLALSAPEKVERLSRVIREEAARAVPRLLRAG